MSGVTRDDLEKLAYRAWVKGFIVGSLVVALGVLSTVMLWWVTHG